MLVHFESLKSGIGRLPKEQLLNPWTVFKGGWYYVVPVLVLIYVLATGRSASLAGFYAIVSVAAIGVIKSVHQKNFREGLRLIFLGLVDGAEKSLIVGTTAGPIGIIIGVALLTGLAFKFSTLVLSFTFGLKWMALMLVFFATFVLGMGMSVTADYMILAILAVPSMGQIGIPLVAAHFAAFWYSQSSNVTPPVCIAAFAGASIAGSNPYKTGIQAMKFSSYLYLMPFLFVYTPILMPHGFNASVLLAWIISFLSTIPFAACIAGYFYGDLKLWQRGLLLLATILLLFPGPVTDGGGILLAILGVLPNYLKKRSEAAQLP
jgi:TRAP transporter 4TM/12TM fusion protein